MPECPAPTILDVTGLLCPLPVLKARKILQTMAPGEILVVIATDPMTTIDLAHFCTEHGHILHSQECDGNLYRFTIRRT